MRHVLLVLFQFFFVYEIRADKLTPNLKSSIVNSLVENFNNFILSNNIDDYRKNLESFQIDLIKNRNFKCDYQEFKLKSFNDNYINLTHANTSEILQYFNNTVRIFVLT